MTFVKISKPNTTHTKVGKGQASFSKVGKGEAYYSGVGKVNYIAHLLLEDGGYLLQESGDKIRVYNETPTEVGKPETSYSKITKPLYGR